MYMSSVTQSELSSHEGRILAVCKEAEAMVSGGHYGTDDITTRQDQLSAKWTQLKVMIPNLQDKQ